MSVAALLALSCGPQTRPVDKVPDVPAAKNPEIVRPSGPYDPDAALELSEDLIVSIRELESTAADPERLCESVERAASLRHTLGSVLQDRFNAVEGTDAQKAVENALPRLSEGLVAIGAGVRGATVSTWLQLSQLRHPQVALDLLAGASEYLGTHDPVYVERRSEARVCAQVSVAERSLHQLAGGWSSAPECVRNALAEDLADVILRLGDARCFCPEKAKALSDVELIAPILEQLVELDGPVAAEELRTGARGLDASFGGECML